MFLSQLEMVRAKEEALKNYQIAIDKDKDGVTAENAKKMIEKIKNNWPALKNLNLLSGFFYFFID